MTELEKMISGQLYNPFDPELTKMRLEARLLTEKFNKTSITELEKRRSILSQLLGSVKDNVYIEPSFHCDYGFNIHVGENFYANYNCVFLDVTEIILGDNCFIGPQVGLYTATHPVNPAERNSGLEYAKKIRIGDNCWIGGHATINPGVTLGNNVVVASGAVVTKSYGDNVVIAGNPTRIIQEIDSQST